MTGIINGTYPFSRCLNCDPLDESAIIGFAEGGFGGATTPFFREQKGFIMMVEREKIGILIPGYNVAGTIDDVLRAFSPATMSRVDGIVVIDNRSTDNTFEILCGIQQGDDPLAQKLTVIRNVQNHGLGGSLKIGLHHMIEHGFTHFMIIHSDKQGNSEEITANFLRHHDRHLRTDAIMASRFVTGADISGYSGLRTLGNHVFNILTFLLTGLRISDSGCGIVFFRTAAVERTAFGELSNSFFFNPQLNILLYGNKDLVIDDIPLNWSEPEAESNLKALRYVLGLTRILVKYRLSRLMGGSGFPSPSGPDWIAGLPHELHESEKTG
jgi:glycosyltransferase involved in cell wall biosynthesis